MNRASHGSISLSFIQISENANEKRQRDIQITEDEFTQAQAHGEIASDASGFTLRWYQARIAVCDTVMKFLDHNLEMMQETEKSVFGGSKK